MDPLLDNTSAHPFGLRALYLIMKLCDSNSIAYRLSFPVSSFVFSKHLRDIWLVTIWVTFFNATTMAMGYFSVVLPLLSHVTPKDLVLCGKHNGIFFVICKTLVEEGN